MTKETINWFEDRVPACTLMIVCIDDATSWLMALRIGPADGDKSLMVFDEPRDVKGTATFTHAHKQRADDQWLYLPALKRGQADQFVKQVRILHG